MLPTTILLIQFRNSTVTARLEQQSIERELGTAVGIVCLSVLDDSIIWNKPSQMMTPIDGVILGGSGDYDFDGGRLPDDGARVTAYGLLEKLRPLLDYLFRHDVPTLGICFGHQVIGAYAGATVVHDIAQKKMRSHAVSVIVDTESYPICTNVPNTFYAHYGHKDCLDRVPEGATLLMSGGAACKVSALCYKQNIFTTQFHPELTIHDVHLRAEATPGYLPVGVQVTEAFIEDNYSSQILKNFSTLVQSFKRE